MTLLSVENLSLAIHGTPILRDVSLDVAAGEVVGVVGESGSGKSMTALAAMGLLPEGTVATGSVALEGRALLGLRERDWLGIRGSEIGMVFQEPMTALNPVHPIGRQIAEPLTLRGAPRAEARAVARARLDRVGLGAIGLDRYPHELSGGQRQRVCLAIALARRPRLLIADEPTTALDVTTQAGVLDLLRGLVDDEGMGLVLITHDLGVVAGMADRTVVMQGGRVVEAGATAALLAAPRAAYTRALLDAARPAPRPARAVRDAPVLRATDLARAYGGTRAVDGVSLTLHRGEALGLVGGSGCGKSTLSRLLLGLEAPDRGAVTLGGRPGGTAMTRADRARISVVFQDPYGSFDPRWTVARIVAEPFHLSGRPPDWRARVGTALEAVGLAAGDAAKYPHEFSGGQRQRIAIARALITEPEVVVLDEAVSALDVRVRAQVLDLLRDLQARLGLAYLFVSHDLSVVRALCDRVLVMDRGRIVERGCTGAVFVAPSHPVTRALVEAAPTLPEPA